MQSDIINQKKEPLDNQTTESLVYLGYYYPKTQAQLVDFVYNFPQTQDGKLKLFPFHYQIPSTPIMPDDPAKMSAHPADNRVLHSKANITPFIKARKKLIENGCIKQLTNNSRKNVYLRSNPTPYISFMKQKINSRYTTKQQNRITDIELKYIEFIIDSDYFRRTFFNNRVFTEYYAFNRSILNIEKEKFVAKSAFQYISNILGHIAIPSYYLVDVFGKDYVKKYDMEDIYKNHTTFDEFYPDFLNKKNKKAIPSNESVKDAFEYLGNYEPERYYFDNVIYNGIFLTIPYDLANKILFLEQGLHTTINAFSGGYQKVYL